MVEKGGRGEAGCLDTPQVTATLMLWGLLIPAMVEIRNHGGPLFSGHNLTATLMLLGFLLLWWLWVLTPGDSGYLNTAKLTASLLLSGPLPSAVVEGSDTR